MYRALGTFRQQHLDAVFDRQLFLLQLGALGLVSGRERQVRVDRAERFFKFFVTLLQRVDFGHRVMLGS